MKHFTNESTSGFDLAVGVVAIALWAVVVEALVTGGLF